jgi:hypothetical protein
VAYISAQWHRLRPPQIVDDLTEDDTEALLDPTDDEWQSVLGAEFDFDAADGILDRVTAE